MPLTPEDARRLIEYYVEHYNTVRLHSAIGFVTPADMLAGRQNEIHGARDRKLEQARQQRQLSEYCAVGCQAFVCWSSSVSCAVARRYELWSYNGVAG